MSYNMRGDPGIFGPSAAVEIPNGAGQSLLAKLQTFEPCGFFGIDAGNVTTAHKYCVFLAPPNPSAASGTLPMGGSYQIIGGSIIANTASTSGTLAIEVCPAGTADGSGNNVLSTTNTSLAAAGPGIGVATPASLTLSTNVDNLIIAPNGRINMIFGGTLTNLVNLNCTLYLIRTS